MYIEAYVIIEDEVLIDARTIIGAGRSIDYCSQLSADYFLYNQKTLYYYSIVSDRNILLNGVIIGSDRFALVQDFRSRYNNRQDPIKLTFLKQDQ
ncbi:hypothetical protein [Coxiella endosymbiont of Rhipicephalus microplus]|uniref:hypothetical protein n=1 Tax=Coxiella endosymbiont of Rhipicephalus microplus TaxID=1656186 RepID=UPI000C80B202|nr:hypothetical protein [Coxiella endosymbiont of Rhipicephalus microplus]